MVLEIAEITVRRSEEDAFAMAYQRAAHLVRDSPGCLSMRMTRGIESPSRFVLLIERESLTAHTAGFRQSSSFRDWRAEIGPFVAAPPRTEHTVDL
ncbi:MAG: antibiotic biosynthesis monooxygenase family protein [Pseudonocardiaceae bacterium]